MLANDKTGQLVKIMNETVDGEYQAMKARDGAYVREKFFGKSPEALELVSSMSDTDIWRLNRGGHDPHKVFAAYDKATKHKGTPTVTGYILKFLIIIGINSVPTTALFIFQKILFILLKNNKLI